jgi:hypothetical protein
LPNVTVIPCFRCQHAVDEPNDFTVRDEHDDFAVCLSCWLAEPFTLADVLGVSPSLQAQSLLRCSVAADDDLYDW